jgi:hypothetical protein
MTADRAVCNSEAGAKGVSGEPAFEAAYKACLDKRGYLFTTLEEARRLAR